ncbi:hypothetical protein ACFQAT_14080 [Undibacterium arcticum]|uniref:Uncharacterized protein n=1 Tax=Undibacterium arcticum TaxID=1762892 RepID=A0ABV7F4W3_9BURK
MELTGEMNEIVTHFYELCRGRFEANNNRHPDLQVHGVLPELDLDKNKQEILEKNGYIFVRPDGKMPGHMMAGLRMMARSLYTNRAASYPKWGILRACNAEFAVADNFMTVRCVPVAPSIFLCADSPNFNLGYADVAKLNAFNVTRADQYYFAKNFDACPIYRRTIPNERFLLSSSCDSVVPLLY